MEDTLTGDKGRIKKYERMCRVNKERRCHREKHENVITKGESEPCMLGLGIKFAPSSPYSKLENATLHFSSSGRMQQARERSQEAAKYTLHNSY